MNVAGYDIMSHEEVPSAQPPVSRETYLAAVNRIDKLEATLRAVAACLTQPVQFTGSVGVDDILRADAAIAVFLARKVLA